MNISSLLRKKLSIYSGSYKFCNKIKDIPKLHQDIQQKQKQIQQQHVNKVYDKIAEHFSQTRYKPWPKVAHFLQHLKKGSLVLDIGCGNGRNMRVNDAIQVIGVDRCVPLVNIAGKRSNKNNLIAADAVKLPIRSQSCDAFISIALLHHFSTQSMRQNAINQFGRILKYNGRGLVYVRALQIINSKNQLVRQLQYQDFFVPWHLQLKYAQNLQKAIQQGHEYSPEKHSIIYQRFYHAFIQGELQELVKKSKLFQIQKSYYDNSNWACIVRKI